MALLNTLSAVPTYSLKESGTSGDPHFEIAQHSGLTPQQKSLFFVPHRKDYYLFVFVRSGSSRYWIDMEPYYTKPDTFCFASPQQVYLKEEGRFEATALSFTQEFLDLEEGGLFKQLPIIGNPHRGHELQLSAADVAFIEDICGKLLLEFRHREGWRNSMLLAYLRILLIYLSRLYSEQYKAVPASPDRALLQRFRALVAEHFTRVHEVADYADMLHLSPGHLSELIKRQSGKTALEHIHDRLLLEAKRLLFHTDSSAKEIAFQLGFEEASYFNRFFKRGTSVTPMHYRGSIREMYH